MIRKSLFTAAVAALVALGGGAEAAWPERPIEVIVPWSAGGGTDTIVRMLASLLEKDLGQPINVVNRTGGAGVIGHTALAHAVPDGYTIGTVNVDLSQTLCLGQTDLDNTRFTHIALFSRDAAGVIVNSDSPHSSVDELLAAIKQSPKGALKASGTVRGGIYHLAFAGWLVKEGVDPDHVPWIPSQGEAPSIRDLAAGAIDVATPPLPSARAMIEAGRIRPLATMSDQRNPLFPDVPTLKEATGVDWTAGTWRMIAGPAGLPEDIRARLEQAIGKAYQSSEFQEFMQTNGFQTAWMNGAEARAYHEEQDGTICEIMKSIGMVATN